MNGTCMDSKRITVSVLSILITVTDDWSTRRHQAAISSSRNGPGRERGPAPKEAGGEVRRAPFGIRGSPFMGIRGAGDDRREKNE